MKYLIYIFICLIGFPTSFFVHKNGGDYSGLSILIAFWTGYLGRMILSLED